mmetsp:Transcript_2817/g.7659  ORF Transcript_2817/g.7659 Transcript_2817/m.7659 type:complete len:236 (+) Transcript_2817:187-894(+)
MSNQSCASFGKEEAIAAVWSKPARQLFAHRTVPDHRLSMLDACSYVCVCVCVSGPRATARSQHTNIHIHTSNRTGNPCRMCLDAKDPNHPVGSSSSTIDEYDRSDNICSIRFFLRKIPQIVGAVVRSAVVGERWSRNHALLVSVSVAVQHQVHQCGDRRVVVGPGRTNNLLHELVGRIVRREDVAGKKAVVVVAVLPRRGVVLVDLWLGMRRRRCSDGVRRLLFVEKGDVATFRW